mgnify:CR=1 FL=1
MTKRNRKMILFKINSMEPVRKSRYEKPFFTSEPMFETAALQSCAKNDPEGICSPEFGSGPLSS